MANENYGGDILSDDLNFNVCDEKTGLNERILRRLQTPRGSLPWAQDDGLDLNSFLNEGLVDAQLRNLESQIKNEINKEEGILSVEAQISRSNDEYRIDIAYQLEEGPVFLAFVAGPETLERIL